MKLGMTSLTLRNYSPREVVQFALAAGLSGIEWGVSDTHIVVGDIKRAQEICDMCHSNDIEIFALGSYCKMEEITDALLLVKTAQALETSVIRVWAGTKSPNECDDEYKKLIAANTRRFADVAGEYGIKLAFEFHGDTLTQTPRDAVSLIEYIDKPNAGLYWQPDFNLDIEENISWRNEVLPYCIGNMHIQNYSPDTGYNLLEEIKDNLVKYYSDIKNMPYNLMIEFVKDSSPKNLIKDAAVLKSVCSI